MLVVGIDAGGSKTVCQVADERAAILAETRGPGSNLPTSGEYDAEGVLRDVIGRALASASEPPAAICLGMAGVDRPREASIVEAMLARIDGQARRLVVNDALIALEAGAPAEAGVVIVAGTGSMAYGRDNLGRAARAGGWGYVLGDEGSGYWLGRQALRAVVRESDGRGPATSLTPLVLAHYGVTRAQDLIYHIYYGDPRPSAIASLGGAVEAAAEEKDSVALMLVDQAARHLADSATSVARRLRLDHCPVVVSGGVFQAVPLLQKKLEAALQQSLPGCSVRRLTVEPALGSVRLALAVARGQSPVPIYDDAEQ